LKNRRRDFSPGSDFRGPVRPFSNLLTAAPVFCVGARIRTGISRKYAAGGRGIASGDRMK
jgi:hypothetical protein